MNSSKRQSSFLETSAHESVYVENNFASISSPKLQLVAVHGLGTYSGWFDGLSEVLAEEQIALTAFDLPGFGRSGNRGHVSSYTSWVAALKSVWAEANSRLPDKTFLLGHSLGGVISLVSLAELDPKPKGLILTVPGLMGHPKSFPPSFVISTLFKAIFNKDEKISYSFPPEVFECVKCGTHQIDFLTAEVNPGVFIEILKASNKAWSARDKLSNIPFMLINSGKDEMVVSWAGEAFFNFCNASCKTYKNFSELGHDLFVLPESNEVNGFITKWMKTTT